MKKLLKRTLSVVLMTAALSAPTTMATAPKAEAGILFLPFIVGLVFILESPQCRNPGFCLLLGTDGSVNGDALTNQISAKYPQLDSLAAADLASAIEAKAAAVTPDTQGRKMVSLDEAEVAQALQASELEESNPALFAQIVADMK